MKSLTAGVWTLVVVMAALLLNTIPPVYDAVWANYFESVEEEPVAEQSQSEPFKVEVINSVTVTPDNSLDGFPVEIQSVDNCQMEGEFGPFDMPCIGVIIGEGMLPAREKPRPVFPEVVRRLGGVSV